MNSCIYVGHLRHKRLVPAAHRFCYRLFMLYLDLDELPHLTESGLVPDSRWRPISFQREDHMGNPRQPLCEAVADLVEQRSGKRPAGPIRLLTPPRNGGHYFSPLSLYYCFDPEGLRVESVVAEVRNIPWRQMHCYVLSDANRLGRPGQLLFDHPKGFHVSPFMDMDMRYRWRLCAPGDRLAVGITNRKEDQPIFHAALALGRRELSRAALARLFLRYPWWNARIILAIHFQAFRLWRKQCPYYPHPERAGTPGA